MNLVQFKASRSGEVGIQSQYLDGELHLVDDALAGRLHLAPKFKIGQIVIQAITVFVMHVLMFVQRAAKVFLHNQGMLKTLFATLDVYAPIASRMHPSFRIYGTNGSAFVPAVLGTKTRFHVEAAVPSSVRVVNSTAFGRFAAILTLKSRWVVPVHMSHWTQCGGLVKEMI